MSDDTNFELKYSAEGVSITEYDMSDPARPTVENEWWYTWVEVFSQLTGIEEYAPSVHSQ